MTTCCVDLRKNHQWISGHLMSWTADPPKPQCVGEKSSYPSLDTKMLPPRHCWTFSCILKHFFPVPTYPSSPGLILISISVFLTRVHPLTVWPGLWAEDLTTPKTWRVSCSLPSPELRIGFTCVEWPLAHEIHFIIISNRTCNFTLFASTKWFNSDVSLRWKSSWGQNF